jgi:hypothetical protein
MHLYRQTITLFGIVVPLIISAVVIGVGFTMKSRMLASFENKQATYKTHEQGRLATMEIEAEVIRQRPHLDRWTKQLAEETASTVTTNLREITSKLPPKEIQLSAFDPSSSGGFGSVSAQKSSQVRIALRGTYRTMQRAFLELETRMPQLQLQDLKMSPNSSQSSLLNFEVSYTAWEN